MSKHYTTDAVADLMQFGDARLANKVQQQDSRIAKGKRSKAIRQMARTDAGAKVTVWNKDVA